MSVDAYWVPVEGTQKLFGLYPKNYQRTKLLLRLCKGPATLRDLAATLGVRYHRKGYRDAPDYVLRSVLPNLNRDLPRVGLEIVDHGQTYELVRSKIAGREVGASRALYVRQNIVDTEDLSHLETFDETRQTQIRLEQSLLRRMLLGGRNQGVCAICGDSSPVGLLTVAHIKRRSDCSDSEKGDRANVVPMCKFGCDDLFERGYIGVHQGRVVAIPGTAKTDVVDHRVKELARP